MRIGSRGSRLARAQAEQVADLLGGAEVAIVGTSGDEQTGGSAGDKSRWVDAIERALSRGEIDLAVHSAKDVPGQLAPGLCLLGCPARAPVEDVLCGASGLGQLPQGAIVGTSSLRRAAQLRAARADLEIVALHGNVDTRLGKLEEGAFDAIVLARAGLVRLGRDRAGLARPAREREIGAPLPPDTFVPSPGQGALALEGRAEDRAAARAAQGITDGQAFACLLAERALSRALEATCNTPLGAWCKAGEDRELHLRAWVGLPDGSVWIADELQGPEQDPESLGARLAERMRTVGAGELLAQAEAIAR